MKTGAALTQLADAYSRHKWLLQLAAWVLAVGVLCLLLTVHCRRQHTATGCSAALTDSLQRVHLPSCQRIDYVGHAVYFDASAHLPLCAIYELTAAETRGTVPRASTFTSDDAVKGCPAPDAYRGSGMERGHLVPAADLKWNSLAMKQSFMMTNICPQDKSLNEGGWHRLEEKVREWVQRDSALIVACGPIIEQQLPRTEGGVVIPRRYFKVVLSHCTRPMRALAFIYPNGPSNGPLRHYAVSVRQVERATGIDFFSALPDEIERRLEEHCDLASFLQMKD